MIAMSYFSRRSGKQRDVLEDCVVEDLECDEQVADGVVVERRSVLWLSAAAIASVLVGRAPLLGQVHCRNQELVSRNLPQAGELSFGEFLKLLYPEAQRLVASKGKDEDAYLMTVAAAMSRLTSPRAPIRDAMRAFSKANRKEGERFPIGVMAMKLKPGRGFSHHDHLDYNGVIMGLDGEVRIRNYDFEGDPPSLDSAKAFKVRQTRDDLILPGRLSTLGRKRENIHDLVAGKNGARVMDVFTFYSKKATSRYMDLSEQPIDAEARIYEANWKQRRRR
jgi:hypothetical protein